MSSGEHGLSAAETYRVLMEWATGRPAPAKPAPAPTAIMVEDASLMPAVHAAGLADSETVIFTPALGSGGPARQVEFSGTVVAAGNELSIGDELFVQVQDYAATAYMALLGPTLVYVTSDADFDLYLADADGARRDGIFPEFALAGAVHVANLPGLGAGADADGPHRRLYVGADGDVSTAPTGARLAHIDALTPPSSRRELSTAWRARNEASMAPCAVCVGAVVDEAHRGPEIAARPWLRRYLEAIDVLRLLRVRNIHDLRVSGFGFRLNADLDDLAQGRLDRPGAPLLAWNDEAGYVCDIGSGRSFQFSRRAIRSAEALLGLGADLSDERITDPEGARVVAEFLDRAGLVAPAARGGD
jgi:hypothetical protein